MNKCTILCVGDHGAHHISDEYNIAFTIKKQLIQYLPDYSDYNVVVIKNGAEALLAIENYLVERLEIPLVIADQMILDMTAPKFLIELHDRHPEIVKIILISQVCAYGSLIFEIGQNI
ncbi:MAG: hypothetical protein WCP16_05450 [Pseudanabaena sp. ELA645]